MAAPSRKQQDANTSVMDAVARIIDGTARRIDLEIRIGGKLIQVCVYRLHGMVPCRVDFHVTAERVENHE